MTNDGLKLALLFGKTPCNLGLCGPAEKSKRNLIEDYIKDSQNKKNRRQAKEIIKEFKGAYPYYQLIAKCNKIYNPLDFRVIEAYWIGNKLLNNVSLQQFKTMCKNNFAPFGKITDKMIDALSKDAIPYHNFHVLNLGSVSGKLSITKKAINLCTVSCGKIIKLNKNSVTVEKKPINTKNGFSLGKQIHETIKWDKQLLPKIIKGDIVTIHWKTAIIKLTNKQFTNFDKYFHKTLQIS